MSIERGDQLLGRDLVFSGTVIIPTMVKSIQNILDIRLSRVGWKM